jgi:hypothetical protein
MADWFAGDRRWAGRGRPFCREMKKKVAFLAPEDTWTAATEGVGTPAIEGPRSGVR